MNNNDNKILSQGKDLWEILNKQQIRKQKSCRKRFFLRQLFVFCVYYIRKLNTLECCYSDTPQNLF